MEPAEKTKGTVMILLCSSVFVLTENATGVNRFGPGNGSRQLSHCWVMLVDLSLHLSVLFLSTLAKIVSITM